MAHITALSLLVRDYDETIDVDVGKLGFASREDSDRGGGKVAVFEDLYGNARDLIEPAGETQ